MSSDSSSYARIPPVDTLDDAAEAIDILANEGEGVRKQLVAVLAEQRRQAATLAFIESQVKLTGQAMELLLASQGLDMPEDSDA